MKMLFEHEGFTAEFTFDLSQWNVKNRCGENVAVIEYDHFRENTLSSGVLIVYRRELKHEDKVSIGGLANKISKCGYVEINVLIEKLVAILSDNTCQFEHQLNETHHQNLEKAIKFADKVACGILSRLGLVSSLESSEKAFNLHDFRRMLYDEDVIVPCIITDKNLLFGRIR